MARHYETDPWPFIPAQHFTPAKNRTVRVVVIHTMEAPEKGNTAEAVANYFRRGTVVASAHICVDADSIIQSVKDSNVAYAAPGCNRDGIQIELAGYARQSVKDWNDPYSLAMLERAASAVAQYCLKYTIPVRHLSDNELRTGKKGIIGHDQVSRVYHKSSHTDPGKDFPWMQFIALVGIYYTSHAADAEVRQA